MPLAVDKHCYKLLKETPKVPGAFLPSCQENGYFEIKQCHGSTGHCWCVAEENGEELEGTRTEPGVNLNCDGNHVYIYFVVDLLSPILRDGGVHGICLSCLPASHHPMDFRDG